MLFEVFIKFMFSSVVKRLIFYRSNTCNYVVHLLLLNETILCFVISKGTGTLFITWLVQRNLQLFALKVLIQLILREKYGSLLS